MKNLIKRLVGNYEFQDTTDFVNSLSPTHREDMFSFSFLISLMATAAEKFLGIDYLAFAGLLVMMVTELITGIWASRVRCEAFCSKRLSRFGLKLVVYLILMSVPYLFQISYENRGSTLVSSVFEWIHVFLVFQVVQEYLVSILENLGCIQGKGKNYWIEKIRVKIKETIK